MPLTILIKTLRKSLYKSLYQYLILALLTFSGVAQAHIGHGTEGLMAGMAHPFGWDHLLAMVAVGLWSVMVLPKKHLWQGPAAFVGLLIVGALMGFGGAVIPFSIVASHLEWAIALSVILFGGLLMLSTSPKAHRVKVQGLGFILIMAAALLHGFAHGAEAPATGSLALFVGGFVITTTLLHGVGIACGYVLQTRVAHKANIITQMVGLTLSAFGLHALIF